MNCVVLVVLGFLCIGCYAAATAVDGAGGFKEFMGMYGKSYVDEAEYSVRFKNFKENLAFIENHNSNPSRTHDVAINHFGDLSHSEYTSLLTINKPSATCSEFSLSETADTAVPTNLDWRSTGNVAPVGNEGQCGSVSYVNVANQISSVLSITIDKPPVSLSAQQMMDCYHSGNDDGCNGGDPWNLYTYVIEAGLETEHDYPYTGENSTGTCNYHKSKTAASITGSGNLTTEPNMKVAVATYGPTVALIDASSQEFEFYSSGIFYTTDCSTTELDHVLLLVGYGETTNSTNYWIAQNVWGTSWGMAGYINILRNKNTCGISTCSSYVTGAYVVPH